MPKSMYIHIHMYIYIHTYTYTHNIYSYILYVDENRTNVLIYNTSNCKINISELEWKGMWINIINCV